MHPLLHLLQIGTLATWLSVAGFGLVGLVISQRHPSPVMGVPDTQWISEDFTLGGEPPSPSEPSTATAPAEPLETLPAPPEIPALTEFAPLPEIPDIPAPAPRKPSPAAKPSTRSTRSTRSTQAPRQGTSSTRKTTAGSRKSVAGTGMSSAARLSAGNMTPPSYPAEARRRGQTGTVVVEFTVDASGRVISASAKSPSPWPLLNNEAVRTVRRWKFPPGPVTTFQRPIVFRLK